MNKNELEAIVYRQLARKYQCTPDTFQCSGVQYLPIVHTQNDGRQRPYLEMLSIGDAVIVFADESLLPDMKKLLYNKTREEIFECPYIYGQSIFYVPDLKNENYQSKCLRTLDFQLYEKDDLYKLRSIRGFENAIDFDESGNTETVISLVASKKEKIIAVAGASFENEEIWEIGIDVMPEFRKQGLGTELVSNLAEYILAKGIVPIYCAASSNIGSQAVAHSSGFTPMWVTTYQNILDGSSAYQKFYNQYKIQKRT